MPNPIDSLPPDVVEAWRSGNKIEAIKRLRQATGVGLAEAKSAVDRLDAALASRSAPGAPSPASGPPDLVGGISAVIRTLGALRGLPPELMAAWRRGDKAAVIAWLREQAATGNAQAKGLADAIERHSSQPHASPSTPRASAPKMPPRPEDMLSPGQVPQAKGGPWMIVVLLLAAAAVWAYFKFT
jgi:hypothetical protein